MAARHQLNDPLASRQPERQGQRRGGADREIHPWRDRLRGLRDRQGGRADLRLGQEQGRQRRSPVPESAALAASQVVLKSNETFSAIWAGGSGSYPITYQSWDLVDAKQPNANDASMLRAYLGYLLGAGQELLPQLGYAPLPSRIDQQAQAQLSKIAG
jgi:hypothetical protein